MEDSFVSLIQWRVMKYWADYAQSQKENWLNLHTVKKEESDKKMMIPNSKCEIRDSENDACGPGVLSQLVLCNVSHTWLGNDFSVGVGLASE